MIFKDVSAQIATQKFEINASELHGLVTGWLSAGAKWSDADAAEVISEWFEAESVNSELIQLVSEVAKNTLVALQDIDLGFQLLMPDDEFSITERQQSISHWCNGFLSGFGTSGRFQQNELADDIAEVFRDLTRIASLDEDIPDDDANETDLMEIGEYVRMSALFVFTECTTKALH